MGKHFFLIGKFGLLEATMELLGSPKSLKLDEWEVGNESRDANENQ